VTDDDDLVSSTLYSLLNSLTHGGSSINPNTAMSVRTQTAMMRDGETINSTGGKKTEAQRRIIAMTAVEVVSRLALDIGRGDVSTPARAS